MKESREEYRLPGAPGKYMPTTTDTKVPKVYFPNQLPPSNLELTEEIINELTEAMLSLGRLDSLASEIENPRSVLSSFVYKEAEQSSQIEGTAVTLSDLYKTDTRKTRGEIDEYEKDLIEAQNYIRALDTATEHFKLAGRNRQNINLQLIKKLHKEVMEQNETEENPLPGEFRPGYTAIIEGQGRARFYPPKPSTAKSAMEDLENYIKNPRSNWPDLIDIALIHYQFETIHPFKDGNGRVGRLLIILLLMASDILVNPVLYLSSYINQRREEYADKLLNVSEAGEWEEWILFFLKGLRQQADEAFSRAKLLLDKRSMYIEKYSEERETIRRIVLDSIFKKPYFTVNELSDIIEKEYPTTNKAVKELEEDGVVTEITGKQTHRVFEATEITDIVERRESTLPEPEDLLSRTS